MDRLIERSQQQINSVDTGFQRYLHEQIDWQERLIALKGARGVGKTTLLLQHLKQQGKGNVLYASLDDIYFAENRLTDVADEFVKTGGKHLYLDEVHKYPQWSREIKNIYDVWPELSIVLSGSSIPEIDKGEADLSRRAVKHELHELSLREYIELVHGIQLPVFSLQDIVTDHVKIAREINDKIKPLKMFREFLKEGSYPFIVEGKQNYRDKIRWVINLIIEHDLPAVTSITYESVVKLRKLLMLISHSVPFKPNISELSEKVGTSRDYLLKYLDLLEKGRLIKLLKPSGKRPSKYLNKPDKIYLNNPSLLYALNEREPEEGTLREIFFVQQLSQSHQIESAPKGDFVIEGQYTFEVGGKNKSFQQVANVEDAYVAVDGIEYGYQHKIPLWLFGFLY